MGRMEQLEVIGRLRCGNDIGDAADVDVRCRDQQA